MHRAYYHHPPSIQLNPPPSITSLRILISCARVMQFNYPGIDLFGPCALHWATLLISKVPCTCTHTHTHRHANTCMCLYVLIKGRLSVPVGDCYESFSPSPSPTSITAAIAYHIIPSSHCINIIGKECKVKLYGLCAGAFLFFYLHNSLKPFKTATK